VSEIDPTGAGAAAAARRVEQAGRSPRQAAQQFEAWLVGHLLEQAAPDEADPVFGGGPGGRLYRELQFQEIGRVVAREGSLGLARQLAAHLEAPGDAAPTPGAGASDEEEGR